VNKSLNMCICTNYLRGEIIWLGGVGLVEDVEDGLAHGRVEVHGAGYRHGKDQDGGLVEGGAGGSLHPTSLQEHLHHIDPTHIIRTVGGEK